jgi:hypothetical protein
MLEGASRSVERPIVVLIHGTFAKNVTDLWSRTDGPFAEDLRKQFPADVEIRRFDWFSEQQRLDAARELTQVGSSGLAVDSKAALVGQAMGPNSEAERRANGLALYEVLLRLEEEKRPYHLAAHSHGGSVVWHALCRSAQVGSELKFLQSWSTFGTPFLTFAPTPTSIFRVLAWSFMLIAAALLGRSMLYELLWRPGDSAQAIVARLNWLDLILLVTAAVTLLAGVCAPILAGIGWMAVRRKDVKQRQEVETRAAEWYAGKARHYWHNEDEVMFLMRLSFATAPIITPQKALFKIGAIRQVSDEYVWRTLGNFLHGNDVTGLSLISVSRHPPAVEISRNRLGDADQKALLTEVDLEAGKTLAAMRAKLSSLSGLPTWEERIKVVDELFRWTEVIHTSYYRMPMFPKLLASGMAATGPQQGKGEIYQPGAPSRALDRAITGGILVGGLIGGAICLLIFRDALLPHTNVAQDLEISSEVRKLRYLSDSYRPGWVIASAMSKCSVSPINDYFAGQANLGARSQAANDLARLLGRAAWLHHMNSLHRAYTGRLASNSPDVGPLPAIIRGEHLASDTACATTVQSPTINDRQTARLWSEALIGMAEAGYAVDARIALNVLRYYSEPRKEPLLRGTITVSDWSGGVLSLLRRAYLNSPEQLLSGADPNLLRQMAAMTGYDAVETPPCAQLGLQSNARFLFGAAISTNMVQLEAFLGQTQLVETCGGEIGDRQKVAAWLRRIGRTRLADEFEPGTPDAFPPTEVGTRGPSLTNRCTHVAEGTIGLPPLQNLVSIYRDFAKTGSTSWPTECRNAGLGSAEEILAVIFKLHSERLPGGAQAGETIPSGLTEAFLEVRELSMKLAPCEPASSECRHALRALEAATRYLFGASLTDGVPKRDQLSGLLSRHWQWHWETEQAVRAATNIEKPQEALNNLIHIALARLNFSAPASGRTMCRALLLDPKVTVASCP